MSNHAEGTSSTSDPSLSPTSATSPRAAGPHRRSSKACETCRVRRVKCTGSPPCEACRAAGLASTCVVRLKARPKRAPSAKLNGRLHEELGLGFENDNRTPPPRAILEKRNPLEQVKAALSVWCADRGVSFAQLCFDAGPWLTSFTVSPLAPAPEIHDIEDQLMDEFLAGRRKVDGESFLYGVYTTYRTIPASLAEDHKALVYATLCIARFNQIGRPLEFVDGQVPRNRQDVTYFRMACDALLNWGRPSLVAVWSLFYLIPYSLEVGGPSETKGLLEQWAWQVRKLGLHTCATADMYRPHDQMGKLFSAIFYIDIFHACLTDLEPSIPFEEIDVDPRPPVDLFPSSQRHCSYFTAKFLAEYSDPHVDTASVEYVGSAEAAWMPHLRELRHAATADLSVQDARAQFRYNWLRLLHYTPHLAQSHLAPQAYAVVARALTQVLYTYADLVAVNQLNPSWSQLHRLVVCGHFLILCYEYGEIQLREGQVLFQMLVELLRRHQKAWPECAELIAGFISAARAFDMSVSLDTLSTLGVEEIGNPAPFTFAYDLWLDFDLAAFAP